MSMMVIEKYSDTLKILYRVCKLYPLIALKYPDKYINMVPSFVYFLKEKNFLEEKDGWKEKV